MRILVCLLLVSSSVAVAGHGDAVAPARVGLGPPSRGAIENVAVTARSHPGHVHVTLAFELTARAKEPTEVSLPLRVSASSSVIGLTLGPDEGQPLEVEVARYRYDRTVAMIRDPALLEQTAPGCYALAVYPVSRGERARVKVELALPHGTPLLLDGVRAATLDLDGTPRRLAVARPVSLGDALEEERDEAMTPLSVDAETSLLAIPPQYDVARRRIVPDLSGWHARERVMPTVRLTERVIPKPFREDEARPIQREISLVRDRSDLASAETYR